MVQKRIIPQIGESHGRKVNFSHRIMRPPHRIYSDILSCDATGILDDNDDEAVLIYVDNVDSGGFVCCC